MPSEHANYLGVVASYVIMYMDKILHKICSRERDLFFVKSAGHSYSYLNYTASNTIHMISTMDLDLPIHFFWRVLPSADLLYFRKYCNLC